MLKFLGMIFLVLLLFFGVFTAFAVYKVRKTLKTLLDTQARPHNPAGAPGPRRDLDEAGGMVIDVEAESKSDNHK